MTDTTADMTSHFGEVNSKHSEALSNIARATSGNDDPRNEAMRSLAVLPIELGYSGGPAQTSRRNGGYAFGVPAL